MWLQCQGMMARKYHLRTLNSPNDFNLFYAVEDRENDNESERERANDKDERYTLVSLD